MKPPRYFEKVRDTAASRWRQLEGDPEVAAPWYQLFNQVQNPRHVLSELLQNADDAEATWASARIIGDEFIFEHNGEDFDEASLASLCKFGFSNKRNLHTIGFRGVGFKSTFSLGDEVRVTSPTLSIFFDKKRFTEPIWQEDAAPTELTCVRVTIQDAYRHENLGKNLSEWRASPLSLLFFRHLTQLRVNGIDIVRSSLGPGPAENSEWIEFAGEKTAPLLLIRSEEEAFPDECLHEIRSERMGNEDFDFPPCSVDIVLGVQGERRLYVVLPTGVGVKLPFSCNAPFLQDPARVKIKAPSISPTNRWLLGRAGRLAAEAMLEWLNCGDFNLEERCRAYRLLPDVDRDDSSLEGACATECEEAFEEIITNQPLLLTEGGSLVGEGLSVTVPMLLYHVWSERDVCEVVGRKGRSLLSRHVAPEHVRVLLSWNLLDVVSRDDVLKALQSRDIPKPDTWPRLLTLWTFVHDAMGSSLSYYLSSKNLRIAPVKDLSPIHT